MHRMSEVRRPQTIRRNKNKRPNSCRTSRLCEQASGIHVRGPEQVLVHLHAMSKLRCDMIDSIEPMLRERAIEELFIAQIAPNTRQTGKSIFIRFEIDVDDSMALAQQTPLQHAAEKSGTTRDQNM